MEESLKSIRDQIDEVDQAMMTLFEKRLDLIGKVAEYKYNNNEKIFDSEREAQVVEKNVKRIKNKDYITYYTEFIHSVMDQSKKIQEKIITAKN